LTVFYCLLQKGAWSICQLEISPSNTKLFYMREGTSFLTPYISPLTLSNFYSILSPFLIFLHIFISLSLYLFCFSFSCFSPLSPYLFCFSPYLFCFSPFSLSPSLLLSPLFLIPLHSPSFSHLLSLLSIFIPHIFFLLSLTYLSSLTFLFVISQIFNVP